MKTINQTTRMIFITLTIFNKKQLRNQKICKDFNFMVVSHPQIRIKKV